MIIAAGEAFRYTLPLRPPARLGARRLCARHGLIIRLENGQGDRGYGEAAPFAGLHREDLGAIIRQWRALQPALIGREISPRLAALQGGFDAWLDGYRLWPSLRHGLETAVLNMLACARETSLAGLLAPEYPKMLPINGLLLDGDDPEQARRLALEGYGAIKLKVGRRALEQDIARVRAVRESLDGAAVALRLDANRSWDFAGAVRFGRAVADCAIDYIEEPLADPGALADFHRLTGLPVALDESLGDCSDRLPVPAGVGAFVLKPMALGGWDKTARLIRLAREAGIEPVISSVFESGVGLAALANGAAALCGRGVPMGLDTYRWLGEDVLEEPFTAAGGRVDVDRVYERAGWLRSELLQERISR